MEIHKRFTSFDREVLEVADAILYTNNARHILMGGTIESNPICEALLADADKFVNMIMYAPGYAKSAIARTAILTQTIVYNLLDGPDGDGKRKALRRHWYSWFKTQFSQPLSLALAKVGDDKEGSGFDTTAWAGRQSRVMGKLVDNERMTYHELWVKDASRMMRTFSYENMPGVHIILAVEKDSLFEDFIPVARAIGACAIVSGKGKMSKAGTEKLLQEALSWRPQSQDFWSTIDADNPVVVIHLSDYDYDGQAVIGPTFADQLRRYIDPALVLEARVGVEPTQVNKEDWRADWYELSTRNRGYKDWARDFALFETACENCGEVYLTTGAHGQCPMCEHEQDIELAHPHGFEVETLKTSEYNALCVEALLTVISFERLEKLLREQASANTVDAANQIVEQITQDNQSYQDLLAEFERLEAIKREFEDRARNHFVQLGEPHKDDWADMGETSEQDFIQHAIDSAMGYASVFEPFSVRQRTEKLVEWLEENAAEDIEDFKTEVIEF